MPRDLAWPATLAGLLEIAARAGDRKRTAALLGLIRPYEGKFIVAADAAFVMGAASRFIALGESALGAAETAQRSFDRALRLEGRAGATALAAATRHARATSDCSRVSDS